MDMPKKKAPYKAIIIQPDGTVQVEELSHGSEGLRTLQVYVGGHIEAVYSADGRVTFFCHDEGAIVGRPMNPLATTVWWGLNPAAEQIGQMIRGTVVITGGPDRDGDTLSAPEPLIELLTS